MMSLTNFVALLLLAATTNGFTIQPQSQRLLTTSMRVSSSTTTTNTDPSAIYDTPTECFIIYPSDEELEQSSNDAAIPAEPRYVCTNAPEEYAWFNGIDIDDMIKTDGHTPIAAIECQETESFRGIPEWECRLSP